MPLADTGAQFSSDRLYRYALWRTWDEERGHVMFIGLNPSTADEVQDDPTIRRCMGFAKRWGYGGIYMLNLFAYRATDPRKLLLTLDPVGPENDSYLKMYAESSGKVIACWGNQATAICREYSLPTGDLWCLGLTKLGQPRHPLYLDANTQLQRLNHV